MNKFDQVNWFGKPSQRYNDTVFYIQKWYTEGHDLLLNFGRRRDCSSPRDQRDEISRDNGKNIFSAEHAMKTFTPYRNVLQD